MTEAEWLACGDPQAMLRLPRAGSNERQLRLFACACCRRVGGLLADFTVRAALIVAERFADGLATDAERSSARKAAQQAAQGRGVTTRPTAPKWARRAASAVYYAAARSAAEAACNAPQLAVEALVWEAGGYGASEAPDIQIAENAAQADLLRDIVGNPFRPRPALARLAPRGGEATIRALAAAIYEERSFDQAPILADALEDAGCPDEDVLSHLRSPGPHVRGCRVIDLIRARP